MARMEGFGVEVERPEIAVYVFDRFGNLIAKQLLAQKEEGKGEAVVSFKGKQERLLVKLGPNLDEKELHNLERRMPFKEAVIAIPGEEKVLDLVVPRSFWECWYIVPYIVKGAVLKSVDGENYPVCYGEVEIYDVDPLLWCLPRLPWPIVERLRDAIIDIIIDPPHLRIPEKIPQPLPWPNGDDNGWCGTPPPPPPPPFGRIEEAEAMKEEAQVLKALQELPPKWRFSQDRFKALSTVGARMNAKLETLGVVERQTFLNSEPVEGVKVSEILYTDTDQFKKLLVDNFIVTRYWLCWWPWIYWIWWPWCRRYQLDLLGTAKLNLDGSFCKIVWLPPCYKDIPDLWFKVKQKINGVERVIYARYPVPCHTYWNHPSNNAVTLIVTDEEAFACYPDPGSGLDHGNPWVVFMSVGNYSLKRIYGSGAGNDPAKIGLYDSIGYIVDGHQLVDGPFGGTLELRLLFSRALETMLPKPVKFYRIKYRVNGIGDWDPLTHEVVRHYSHFDSGTNSLEFPAYPLGPRTVGSENALFEIPPKEPPKPPAQPDADWYVINAHVDLPNAYLGSGAINGFVEFKLELFDKVGSRINPLTYGGGIPIYIPGNNDIWNTIAMVDPATVNPSLVVNDPENPSFKTFILKLVIENRKAQAFIGEPLIQPSGGKIGDCGFIRYETADTDVKLPFEARQHREFAWYRFMVIRRIDERFKQTGLVGNMGASGLFEPVVSLATLLAGCPDGEAAFSESLYIWHKTFNGWSRLEYLDHWHVRAFALAPKPTPSP